MFYITHGRNIDKNQLSGGFLQGVWGGYGGLRLRQDRMDFNPILPVGVTEVKFTGVSCFKFQKLIEFSVKLPSECFECSVQFDKHLFSGCRVQWTLSFGGEDFSRAIIPVGEEHTTDITHYSCLIVL